MNKLILFLYKHILIFKANYSQHKNTFVLDKDTTTKIHGFVDGVKVSEITQFLANYLE